MTKRKLPSGVQERSGKYIVTVMVAGTVTGPANTPFSIVCVDAIVAA